MDGWMNEWMMESISHRYRHKHDSNNNNDTRRCIICVHSASTMHMKWITTETQQEQSQTLPTISKSSKTRIVKACTTRLKNGCAGPFIIIITVTVFHVPHTHFKLFVWLYRVTECEKLIRVWVRVMGVCAAHKVCKITIETEIYAQFSILSFAYTHIS